MEEHATLVSELLAELKASAKRWFLAFCIMVIIELATIVGFLWYLSLPVEEYDIEQATDSAGDNFAVGRDFIGAPKN